MSRPAQLEEQMKRVQAIQAELSGEPPATPPAGDPPADPPVGTPPAPPPIEAPATIAKDEYDKLEQRYRTLQGMHKADVASLRGELSAATNAIQELENRVIAAEAAKTTTPPAPAKYVTDEDVEEFGSTIEMVRRAAREEAEAIFGNREVAYQTRIAELEKQVGHVRNTVVPAVESITHSQAEQAKFDFWNAIETNVPNWRTINETPDFKAWLLAEDPLTGTNRQHFLSQAQSSYDAQRVIRFFKEWERTAAGGQTPAPKKANSELEQLVAPGASRGTAPPDSSKKQWTRAEISQFYQDCISGKFATKADERKRIEAEIFLAQKEGRVS